MNNSCIHANLIYWTKTKIEITSGWIDIGKIKTYISIITNQDIQWDCHVTSECLEVESVESGKEDL